LLPNSSLLVYIPLCMHRSNRSTVFCLGLNLPPAVANSTQPVCTLPAVITQERILPLSYHELSATCFIRPSLAIERSTELFGSHRTIDNHDRLSSLVDGRPFDRTVRRNLEPFVPHSNLPFNSRRQTLFNLIKILI